METLKQLRLRLCISQQDLAKLSGVAKTTIVRIETGQRAPRLVTRRKLAKALGVKPDEIEFD